MPRKSPRVEVTTRGGPFRGASRATIQRRALKMLRCLELDHVELSVALVDDAAIRDLNSDYRGYDKSTDVLAFAMREGDPMPPAKGAELLGDVVISVDTARRQARKLRRPLLDELTMLLAHGLLHLLGYDHATKADDRIMKARTRDLERAARLPISSSHAT